MAAKVARLFYFCGEICEGNIFQYNQKHENIDQSMMYRFFLSLIAVLTLSTCQHETRLPISMAMCSGQPAPETQAAALCHDPIAAFADFAKDAEFRNAHPAPASIAPVLSGIAVGFPVAGGPDGKGYLVKAASATSRRCLLLFHEWWGLNDYVKQEADYWSKELNINVLAVDLYDGKVGATPDEAGQLMKNNDAKRSVAIIEGAAKSMGKKAKFYTMGWCFGGGWSLKASLALKKKAVGCVMYYGMPEKDVETLKKLSPNVLFIHAQKDKWINDEVVAEFEKNMKAAGKNLEVHRYDADHAFANPSGQRYHEPSAVAARAVVKKFLSN